MEEQYIPIDIHVNKLLDWLISRRHCNKDWQKQVLVIREKINNAIQDMPEREDVTKLLSGTYINYFHCLRILEILKETEADTKNIFGRYGSQRMKDWQEVVKLYEENVYLAEVAQMLIRNITYEIPSLKRQITKCDQVQLECDRKEAEYIKNASVFRAKFYASCKEMGIEGNNLKKEFVELVKELPGVFEDVAERTKSVQESRNYYEAFVKYILGEDPPQECLPMISYIIDHGNTTTYEWRYGEPPLRIEETPLNIECDDEKVVDSGGGIDFGDSDAVNGDTIDFGDSATNNGDTIDFSETLETGDIDWGNIGDAEIDWDGSLKTATELQETDFNIPLKDAGIIVEDTGMEGGVARDNEALTLLDNPKCRNMFINELLELEAFLCQRLQEMQEQASDFSFSQLQDIPSNLQMQTENSMRGMLENVQQLNTSITTVKLNHLYLIKSSPRYVDRLTDSLKKKLAIADKMLSSAEAMKTHRKESIQEQLAIQPKLKLLTEKTKILQAEIENDISKRYKNRPVNIMGGIK